MSFVSGMILIDAPHSALNMAGLDKGLEQNKVVVKKFKKGRNEYPYVSAQSWRFWWRMTLQEHFDWKLSGLIKIEGRSQAITETNPIDYPDDDIFGYMKAQKDNQTVTRISPLKTTPLVSILPAYNSVVSDFGVFSRHEGNPVPYEQQFYSTVLKGAFSLDLDSLGKFTLMDRAGYKNIAIVGKNENDEGYKKLLEKAKENGVKIEDNYWTLPKELRKTRAVETLKALKYLNGGAKQTLFLTDVVPKFIILGIFEGGINPFITDIILEEKGEIKLSVETLVSRIVQYQDILKSKKIIIGKDKGFFPNWEQELMKLNEEYNADRSTLNIVYFDNIGDAIESFTKEVEKDYGSS